MEEHDGADRSPTDATVQVSITGEPDKSEKRKFHDDPSREGRANPENGVTSSSTPFCRSNQPERMAAPRMCIAMVHRRPYSVDPPSSYSPASIADRALEVSRHQRFRIFRVASPKSKVVEKDRIFP